MTNTGGQIQESIWRDRDFRALPRTAQMMYTQLLSQKEIDRAGIQPLQVSKWAKGCDEMGEADVWRDLETLQAHRFVYVDTDTDEVFVRSYMRQSNVIRQPNLMKNALKCALMVESEMLRRELATELRRLRRADANQVADDIDIENPSETLPEPFPNPSGTLPEGLNPSGTLPEPRGKGKGEGKGSFSSLVTSREGASGISTGRDTVSRAEKPPPETCNKHPDGTPESCGPCKQARLSAAAWHERQREIRRTEARDRAQLRVQAICECELCDDDGYVGTTICDHDPRTAESAKRGRELVQAALRKNGTT